jgi:hypothetical protein
VAFGHQYAQACGGQDPGVLIQRTGVGDAGDAGAQAGEFGREPSGVGGDVGEAELAAGPQHPGELGGRLGLVGEGAQRAFAQHRAEGTVGAGQLLGVCGGEAGLPGQPRGPGCFPGQGRADGGVVHALHSRVVGAGQEQGGGPPAAGDIEHAFPWGQGEGVGEAAGEPGAAGVVAVAQQQGDGIGGIRRGATRLHVLSARSLCHEIGVIRSAPVRPRFVPSWTRTG